MGLIKTEVETALNGNNVKYYESLGYEIPKRMNKYGKFKWEKGSKIVVEVKDLPISSGVLLDFECDNCGKHFQRSPNAFHSDSQIEWSNMTVLCRECANKQNAKRRIGNSNASISKEDIKLRKIKYRDMLYDYVMKNGYPYVIDFCSENKLPCYSTFQSMFGIENVYELLICIGVTNSKELRFFYGMETKEDVISDVYALCNHLGRDVKYTDFQPNLFNNVTIHHINKHFGTIQQMKNELNMTCLQSSYGSVYRFDDGEVCVSTFEKDFSGILRNNGFIYNSTYFRNVRYSSFCDCGSNINCDYQIILPNGDIFYLEIAGMLKNERVEYTNNLPIKDKIKSEYKDTLKRKETLFKSVGVMYLIYIPRKDGYIEEMEHILKNIIISDVKNNNILLDVRSGHKKHIV